MYLTSYNFTGDPHALVAGHDRMFAAFPREILDLHLVVSSPDGMTIYDACPDEATARAFASGAEFASALAGAGLPSPSVTFLGDIASVIVKPALVG